MTQQKFPKTTPFNPWLEAHPLNFIAYNLWLVPTEPEYSPLGCTERIQLILYPMCCIRCLYYTPDSYNNWLVYVRVVCKLQVHFKDFL